MALQLGQIVGKIGGGGEVIREPLGAVYSGAAYSTLREIEVAKRSFVAAHVTHKQDGGFDAYGDPAPFLRITSGDTVITTMTPSESGSNYVQPMRVTATLDPGTYRVQFTASTSRQVRLTDLIISITPT